MPTSTSGACTTTLRLALVACSALVAASCGSWPETRVESRWLQGVLFPVNVVPDVVATAVSCAARPFVALSRDEDPGNLCGLAVPFAPIFGQ